jgi:hypothetical protein
LVSRHLQKEAKDFKQVQVYFVQFIPICVEFTVQPDKCHLPGMMGHQVGEVFDRRGSYNENQKFMFD